MLKKSLIALAFFTAGELTLAIRLNLIANRVAIHNARRPIVVDTDGPLSYLAVKFADVSDTTPRRDIPLNIA